MKWSCYYAIVCSVLFSMVVFLPVSAADAKSTTKREADEEKARRGLTRGTFYSRFLLFLVINLTPGNAFPHFFCFFALFNFYPQCHAQQKVIGELSLSRQAYEDILSAKNKELEVTKVC